MITNPSLQKHVNSGVAKTRVLLNDECQVVAAPRINVGHYRVASLGQHGKVSRDSLEQTINAWLVSITNRGFNQFIYFPTQQLEIC
jgi:hypothetical protein